MSYFITPKHSGTIDNFLYPLLALKQYGREEWVSCEDFKNTLFDLYVNNKIETEWVLGDNGEKCMKSDSSDYTKDLQLPAYFGFVEADSFQRNSSKRITRLGETLLQKYESAGNSFDCDAVKDIFLQAMKTIPFGRGNYGVINSDSDLEAPAIYLKSAILLDGLSVKEFAYIIEQMEKYHNNFSKVIIDVKRRRKQKLSLKSDVSTDIKFVTLFKNIGILVDGPVRNLNYVCDYYMNFKYDEISALPIDNKEKKLDDDIDIVIDLNMSDFLQKIYYGAPGTGKSNEIKQLTGEGKDGVKFSKDFTFRTTFHPDSDYSSFVGCYKPTQKERIVNFKSWDELKQTAENLPSDNGEKVKAIVNFIRKNAESIKKVIEEKGYDNFSFIFGGSSQESDNQDGERFCWNSNSYLGSFLEEILKERQDNYNGQLTYAFTPQAFTKAYVAAWTHPTENVALVIEEINRGNCAQIFGDIFQLLDRESNGLSKYPIEADIDMQAYLNKQFANLDNIFDGELQAAINNYYKDHYDTAFNDIKSGKILSLPTNLSILCTMNTSDQSLFPMDSAFKRRWDWQYMPITNVGLEWEIGWEIEDDKKRVKFKIDWWDFLKRINKVVADLTTSEDKQLGYFFCQPDSFIDSENKSDNDKYDLITGKHFVDKVIFYLWNDVFKDYAFDASCCKDGNGKEVLFAQFYEEDGKSVNTETLKHFFETLQSENDTSLVKKISTEDQDEREAK